MCMRQLTAVDSQMACRSSIRYDEFSARAHCMACDLYLLHTRPAQVQLNSMPSFVITYVICLTYFLPFPFALSIQMLCTYIPVGLIFRLDLKPSMLGLPCFILILHRAVIAVCLVLDACKSAWWVAELCVQLIIYFSTVLVMHMLQLVSATLD